MSNRIEPLCETVTLSLTPTDKSMLARMAEANGSTMRGFVRKLIRDAAKNSDGVRNSKPHLHLMDNMDEGDVRD